jgi:hypothetical protein
VYSNGEEFNQEMHRVFGYPQQGKFVPTSPPSLDDISSLRSLKKSSKIPGMAGTSGYPHHWIANLKGQLVGG